MINMEARPSASKREDGSLKLREGQHLGKEAFFIKVCTLMF